MDDFPGPYHRYFNDMANKGKTIIQSDVQMGDLEKISSYKKTLDEADVSKLDGTFCNNLVEAICELMHKEVPESEDKTGAQLISMTKDVFIANPRYSDKSFIQTVVDRLTNHVLIKDKNPRLHSIIIGAVVSIVKQLEAFIVHHNGKVDSDHTAIYFKIIVKMLDLLPNIRMAVMESDQSTYYIQITHAFIADLNDAIGDINIDADKDARTPQNPRDEKAELVDLWESINGEFQMGRNDRWVLLSQMLTVAKDYHPSVFVSAANAIIKGKVDIIKNVDDAILSLLFNTHATYNDKVWRDKFHDDRGDAVMALRFFRWDHTRISFEDLHTLVRKRGKFLGAGDEQIAEAFHSIVKKNPETHLADHIRELNDITQTTHVYYPKAELFKIWDHKPNTTVPGSIVNGMMIRKDAGGTGKGLYNQNQPQNHGQQQHQRQTDGNKFKKENKQPGRDTKDGKDNKDAKDDKDGKYDANRGKPKGRVHVDFDEWIQMTPEQQNLIRSLNAKGKIQYLAGANDFFPRELFIKTHTVLQTPLPEAFIDTGSSDAFIDEDLVPKNLSRYIRDLDEPIEIEAADGNVIFKIYKMMVAVPIIYNSSMTIINIYIVSGLQAGMIIPYYVAKQLGFDWQYKSAFHPMNTNIALPFDENVKYSNGMTEVMHEDDRDVVEALTAAAFERNQECVDPSKPCAFEYGSMKIELSGNPLDVRAYRQFLTQDEDDHMSNWIVDAVNKGVIHPVDGDKSLIGLIPMMLNYRFVMKENGTIRTCFDARQLNAITKDDVPGVGQNAYETARGLITNGFDSVTRLDLTDAFQNVALEDNDKFYICISFRGKLYKVNRMIFGLKNAGIQFNKVINAVLAPFAETTISFVDDILIYTKGDATQHALAVNKVVNALTDANLKLNINKTQLNMKQLTVLGMVVNKNEILMHPDKYQALHNADFYAKNLKDVQSFVGLANYVSAFIPKFANIMRPLRDLMVRVDHQLKSQYPNVKKHNKKMLNEDDKVQANMLIEQCRKEMVNVIKLAALNEFDDQREYVIYTDASKRAIGGFLLAPTNAGYKLVAIMSKSIDKLGVNLSTTSKELLAVVTMIRDNRWPLVGRKIRVFTDHQALTSPNGVKNERGKADASLWEFLSQYNITFEFCPGASNVFADFLSRNPTGEFDDDKIVYEANLSLTVDNIANQMSMENDEIDVIDDNNKTHKLMMMKSDGTADVVLPSEDNVADDDDDQDDSELFSESEEYDIENDDISDDEHISNDYKLKRTRFKWLKDAHGIAHDGAWTMVNVLKNQGIQWPNMHKDAQKYVMACKTCLKFHPAKTMFESVRAHESYKPFDYVQADMAGPFPTSTLGNQYFILVADGMSGHVSTQSIKSKDAEVVAQGLAQMFANIGTPGLIQFDNARDWNNKVVKKLLDDLKIEHRFAPAYHPSSNGLVERHIGVVKKALVKSMDASNIEIEKWDSKLPIIQLAVNSRPNKPGGLSAFEVVHGRRAYGNGKWNNNENITEDIEAWHKLLDDAEAAVDEIANKRIEDAIVRNEKMNKNRAMQNRLGETQLAIGTKVMIKNKTSKKFGVAPYSGPYVIIDCNGTQYTIKDLETDTIKNRRVTRDMIKIVDVSSDQEYPIDAITGVKYTKSKDGKLPTFRIKWTGYDEPTWEPIKNVDPDMADKYLKLVKANNNNENYVWNLE